MLTRLFDFSIPSAYTFNNIQLVSGVARIISSPLGVFNSASIQANVGVPAQKLLQFVATTSITAPDQVQFAFRIESQLMYFNGYAWVPSDGTLSQTNDLQTIARNINSLLSVNSVVFPYALLNSGTSTTTPTLTNMIMVYSYGGLEQQAPNICNVYGFVRDIQGKPVENVSVKFSLTSKIPNEYMESLNHVLQPSEVIAVTDANGYFQQPLISSQFQGVDTEITVQFIKDSSKILIGPTRAPLAIKVPFQESADITTLLYA